MEETPPGIGSLTALYTAAGRQHLAVGHPYKSWTRASAMAEQGNSRLRDLVARIGRLELAGRRGRRLAPGP